MDIKLDDFPFPTYCSSHSYHSTLLVRSIPSDFRPFWKAFFTQLSPCTCGPHVWINTSVHIQKKKAYFWNREEKCVSRVTWHENTSPLNSTCQTHYHFTTCTADSITLSNGNNRGTGKCKSRRCLVQSGTRWCSSSTRRSAITECQTNCCVFYGQFGWTLPVNLPATP